MTELEVGCAIIEKNRQLLIAQRMPGDSFGGFWEFPGGKKENHETMEECLVREIQEELDVIIKPKRFFLKKSHDYPERKVHLHFYICDWISGTPVKKEVHNFAWVEIPNLKTYQFLPADIDVINEIIRSERILFGPGFE